MKKMLIAYYSWTNGNTEWVAEKLQEATGADLVRIETTEPYPEDYDETVEQGHREVNEGFRPQIEELGVNPADYDVIAVGTPTWWYTMAPAVATFMDAVPWEGRTVVPFMTNAGWPGHVISDMEEAAEGAASACALEVQFDGNGGSDLVTPESAVTAWAARVAKLLA